MGLPEHSPFIQVDLLFTEGVKHLQGLLVFTIETKQGSLLQLSSNTKDSTFSGVRIKEGK